ncbi:MAG: double zinc ribbon domain-containing protein [Halobacteriota archaeon]
MTSNSCPSCNEQVSDDAKFCARCGAALDDSLRDAEIALDQDRNICPACGVAYVKEAKFCHNCGNKLEIVPPQRERKVLFRLRRHLRRRR